MLKRFILFSTLFLSGCGFTTRYSFDIDSIDIGDIVVPSIKESVHISSYYADEDINGELINFISSYDDKTSRYSIDFNTVLIDSTAVYENKLFAILWGLSFGIIPGWGYSTRDLYLTITDKKEHTQISQRIGTENSIEIIGWIAYLIPNSHPRISSDQNLIEKYIAKEIYNENSELYAKIKKSELIKQKEEQKQKELLKRTELHRKEQLNAVENDINGILKELN